MHDLIQFNGYRSILCLNGILPDASFFKTLNLPIIAADGATNSLLKQAIQPQLILGDLDSVQAELLEKYPFLYLGDQEFNDYQKAMSYLAEKNLLPAIVVGINGGYLDHILNNINIFVENDCLLYAPPIRGFALRAGEKINLTLPPQTKISLIAVSKACVSSAGLKWELHSSHLSFPGKTSCFNRTVTPEIGLEIHEGCLLVLVYEHVIEDAGYKTGLN